MVGKNDLVKFQFIVVKTLPPCQYFKIAEYIIILPKSHNGSTTECFIIVYSGTLLNDT